MTPRPIRSIPCLHLHLHHHIPIRLFSVPLAITGSPLAVPTSRVTDKVVHRSLRALRGFLCFPFKACGESFLSARPPSPPCAATRAQAPARGCARVSVCVHAGACVHVRARACVRVRARAGARGAVHPCMPPAPPPLRALSSAAPAPRLAQPTLTTPGAPATGQQRGCCRFCALCLGAWGPRRHSVGCVPAVVPGGCSARCSLAGSTPSGVGRGCGAGRVFLGDALGAGSAQGAPS